MSDQSALVSVRLRIQDYKSLCAPVTICATLVVPKCFLSILTPVIPKSTSNPRQLLHPCQMHPRCKFGDCRSVAWRDNADVNIFYHALKPSKVGQGDLVFALRRLFTSTSLCTRFQVSVYSGYDLCYQCHIQTDPDRQTVFIQPICIAQSATIRCYNLTKSQLSFF